jgi:hypothetical protein
MYSYVIFQSRTIFKLIVIMSSQKTKAVFSLRACTVLHLVQCSRCLVLQATARWIKENP